MASDFVIDSVSLEYIVMVHCAHVISLQFEHAMRETPSWQQIEQIFELMFCRNVFGYSV